MKNKNHPKPRLDAALLEIARELRGTLLSERTADTITARILRKKPSMGTVAGGKETS